MRALTLLDNGAAVVGADLLDIGAALFVLAPDGCSKRIWTSEPERVRSLPPPAMPSSWCQPWPMPVEHLWEHL